MIKCPPTNNAFLGNICTEKYEQHDPINAAPPIKYTYYFVVNME
jgi:hypothetical protein